MMKFKKPKFWDLKKPNIYSNLLKPFAVLIGYSNKLKNFCFSKKKYKKIKTICVGNIYLGGTGKTSLCLKIYDILSKKFKCCFIKKFYKDQEDEQKLLQNKGKLFCFKKRSDAIEAAIKENYEIAIFDDGLQDNTIQFDKSFVCFNNINWIGNGQTIPSGPLREDFLNIKNYENIFIIGNLENLEQIKKQINEIAENINLFVGEYIPINIHQFDKGSNYLAFSGIGNHKTFIEMLKKFGLNIKENLEYPDHYEYSEDQLKQIYSIAEKNNYKILTTEKDYLRLEKKKYDKILFIKSELKITDEKKFLDTISNDNETH